MLIDERALKLYIKKTIPDAGGVEITRLGAGVHGAGYLIDVTTGQGVMSYVVKGLFPEGLGHDYPSDRAAVFLLDLDEHNLLPRHAKAIDVLAVKADGTVISIGGGREYYFLMERVEGTDYFNDLRQLSAKKALEERDRAKIMAMSSYLAEIHSVKQTSRSLYWRKVRDIIGHGECLMGVFDTYPDGVLSYREMAEIERGCVDWRARLKEKDNRLCQVHGDFHPGNIWFRGNDPADFILLDRSRGPWGEAADDITALAINYIFYSVWEHGDLRGACKEGIELFFSNYLRLTKDHEILEVVAPFFAFRGAVVANPIFYPDLPKEARQQIFTFVRNVLSAEVFEVAKVNDYLSA
ncbi:MAG: phosphotransferase [Nitrospirales bacterium]|nr:phosphotransferase [Nitrospirales bacterium]